MNRAQVLGCSILTAMAMTAAAQQEFPIWPEGTEGVVPGAEPKQRDGGRLSEIRNPTLTVYPVDPAKRNGTAVVVCPGGGYGIIAADHEGRQVAEWLRGLGVTPFVLKYRLPSTGPQYRHPVPLSDAQQALRLVRARAAEFDVAPDRIGILGFSAGGHLAATATTLFDEPVQPGPVSCRPDFSILVYPVISFVEPNVMHGGSRNNLLGKDPPADLATKLSPDLQVTERTPPVFLAHARDDRGVPLANSERMAAALKKAGIPMELKIYEQGGHGFGLGRSGQDSAAWPADCAAWMKARGLLDQ